MSLVLQGILNMPYPDDPAGLDYTTWVQAKAAMRSAWAEIEEQRKRIEELEAEMELLKKKEVEEVMWRECHIEELETEVELLREASQSVMDRWDTPGHVINRLRAALARTSTQTEGEEYDE